MMFRIILLLLLPCYVLAEQPKKVEITQLASVLVTRTYHPSAEVKLIDKANLAAEINAPIKEFRVLVGDEVKKGQVLINLDCRDIKLALNLQKAQIKQYKVSAFYAKKQYDRAKKLARKSSISIENKELKESAWKQAEAVIAVQAVILKQNQAQVKKCQIKAPFAGIITQRIASTGDFATIGRGLLEISANQVELSALLNMTEIKSLIMTSDIYFNYEHNRYLMELRKVIKTLNSVTHTQEVRFSFIENKAPAGAFGHLTWQTKKNWLPVQYIQRRKSQLGYFILDNETDQAQFIPLAKAIEGVPAKLETIPNQQLIIKGVYNLQTGDAIQY